jgi:DNA-binding LytR/AlgR family response regulator
LPAGRLPPELFYRVHKSHIVNCACIQKITISRAASSVLLRNGEMVSISRRRLLLFAKYDWNGMIRTAA